MDKIFNKSSIFSYLIKASKYGTMVAILYYFIRIITKRSTSKLHYNDNALNFKIIEKLKASINYTPTFYLPSLLTQLFYNEYKLAVEMVYKREYLETDDGGIISLDWVTGYPSKSVNKILVILHGMTGGSETSYIRDIVDGFRQTNEYKVVVVQFRGINDTPLITPKSYHCANTGDIRQALKFIQRNLPDFLCFCLGVSMGAYLLAKLFGIDQSFNHYVKGFVSISNPFNLLELEKRLRGGLFDFFLRNRQKTYLKNNYNVLKYNKGKDF